MSKLENAVYLQQIESYLLTRQFENLWDTLQKDEHQRTISLCMTTIPHVVKILYSVSN